MPKFKKGDIETIKIQIENGQKQYIRYAEGAQLYSIEYVIGCMGKNTTKVRNIKAYLMAALFNAGSTMGSYYKAEVNHDMPQFAG